VVGHVLAGESVVGSRMVSEDKVWRKEGREIKRGRDVFFPLHIQ